MNIKNIDNKMVLVLILSKILVFISMDVTLMNDSASFIDVNGFDIFRFNLDMNRTPIYPLIIELFQKISPDYFLELTIWFQLLISIISTIYLYKALEKMKFNLYLVNVVTLLYSISSCVGAWEVHILSESLALSLTVILMYYMIEFYYSISFLNATKLALLSFLLIFLRPTSVLLAGLVFAYIIVYSIMKKENIKNMVKNLLPMVTVFLSVLLYMNLFETQHHFKNLSATLPRQQLVQVIEADIYAGINNDIEKYIDKELQIREETNADTTTLTIATIACEEFGYDVISKFAVDAMMKEPVSYLINRVNETMRETAIPFGLVPNNTNNAFIILIPFRVLAWIISTPITFMMGFQAALFSFMIAVYKFLYDKEIDIINIGVFIIIAGIYSSSIFGTFAGYARTSLQAVPFIILSFTFVANFCIEFIKSKYCLNNNSYEEDTN